MMAVVGSMSSTEILGATMGSAVGAGMRSVSADSCVRQPANRVASRVAMGYELGHGSCMSCAAGKKSSCFTSAASQFCGGIVSLQDPTDKWCRPLRGVQASTATQERMSEAAISSSRPRRTLYDVLGVSKGATAQEIKTAYRQLVRRVHPDVAVAEHRQESTKSFLQVQNAYATLSDSQKRAAYDLQLSLQAHQASGYGYRGPPSTATTNWGFTSCTPPQSSTSSSQWKGRRWETDQCW